VIICVWVTISLRLIFWVEIVRCTLSQLVDLFCLSQPMVFSIWIFNIKILSPILCLILIQILILSKPDLNNNCIYLFSTPCRDIVFATCVTSHRVLFFQGAQGNKEINQLNTWINKNIQNNQVYGIARSAVTVSDA